jgi:ornithine cyclodeaminase
MTLLISKAEVESLLNLEQAMTLTLEAFREQAAGGVVALPPRHIPVPKGALRIVSGALVHSHRMGVRVGSAEQLAGGGHAAVLFDSEDGKLLSVMDFPFGTLRTGATIGVATKFFARAEAHVVGMIGTGRNALSLLEAACHVRPIESIRIYSRSSERRTAFAQEAQAALGKSVEPVASNEAAARGAEIVYVATDSLTPVLHADWVSPGAFVAGMGRPSEIDPSVYLASDLVVVGHKGHEQEYHGIGRFPHHLVELVQKGQLEWNSVHEMCDVVVGRVPGRTSEKQIIIFKESGGGFGDIAFANWLYGQAREKGMGQEWNIG